MEILTVYFFSWLKQKKKGKKNLYFFLIWAVFQIRMVSFCCKFGFYCFPPPSHSEQLLLKTMFCLKMTIFIKVVEEGEEQPLAAAVSGWGLGPQTLLHTRNLILYPSSHIKWSHKFIYMNKCLQDHCPTEFSHVAPSVSQQWCRIHLENALKSINLKQYLWICHFLMSGKRRSAGQRQVVFSTFHKNDKVEHFRDLPGKMRNSS